MTNKTDTQAAEKRYRFYKATVEEERKSRYVTVLIRPSVHDAAKERARQDGISVNELFNRAIAKAVGEQPKEMLVLIRGDFDIKTT